MKKKLAASLATVGISAVALIGCGEPSGSVSPSGTNWNVVFTRDFQLSVGRPLVRAVAQCVGSSVYTRTSWYGFNSASPETKTLSIYCANGILSGTWEDSPS